MDSSTETDILKIATELAAIENEGVVGQISSSPRRFSTGKSLSKMIEEESKRKESSLSENDSSSTSSSSSSTSDSNSSTDNSSICCVSSISRNIASISCECCHYDGITTAYQRKVLESTLSVDISRYNNMGLITHIRKKVPLTEGDIMECQINMSISSDIEHFLYRLASRVGHIGSQHEKDRLLKCLQRNQHYLLTKTE